MASLRKFADLGLLAYLRLQGFQHYEARIDGSRVIFLFADTPALRQAQGDYESDVARVGPQNFHKALKAVRTLASELKTSGSSTHEPAATR